jgi:hypothetical protein
MTAAIADLDRTVIGDQAIVTTAVAPSKQQTMPAGAKCKHPLSIEPSPFAGTR